MISVNSFYTFVYGERVGDAPPPPFLAFRSSKAFILTTIVIAVFTDMFLYSVVVPILPFTLTGRAGIPEDQVQKWTSVFLSTYGAALAVGSPIAGWFADRTSSRRTPLLSGLIALGGSTVLLCLGTSLPAFIAGRILQGLSATIVWTVGLALLSDTVEKEELGQSMGYTAMAFSVGGLAGPLLGGVVYAGAGYYAVFAMGFGLIGLDIILRLMMIEKKVAAQWDVPTSPTPASTIDEITPLPEIYAVPVTEKSLEAPESKKKITLPPMISLLRIPRLLTCLFGVFVQATALASFDAALPLYVKETFHWSSTGAGLIFICLVIPSLLSPVFGYLSDKFGSRLITTFGFLGSIPFWVCLRFVTYDTMSQKVLLCALLFLIGLTLSMGMAPLMAEIDHVVELEEKRRPGSMGTKGAAAQGFGLFNSAFAIGSLIGPLWAGFVVQSSGWGTMGWSLGLLSGVAAIATFWWTGGRIMLKERKGNEACVV